MSPPQPAARRTLRAKSAGIDDLEVRALDPTQGPQVVVPPARVRRARDVPVRTVVRDEHSVARERGEDDTGLPWVATDVEARLQAHAKAHRRQARVVGAAREVSGRVDMCSSCATNGEPQGVVDDASPYLVVPCQAGEDREACRVCGGPAGGGQRARAGSGTSARARSPSATPRVQGIELV